ncbi:outer membrane receptor protein involved in Fe transport [Mucilaginibacter gracilis]|uniref:Outer membrane receptor protein involved in Fe transport n=1 Tax=Mucilaginibacter gracilis TaxID=423350 RepID=A0A495IXY5_9SPHI|nr:outer membrane beta-barrel family protein [Mucilaginibacter gracilis]RKR81363.1 outer membrane receptor protein involved in Fe transport [Mucilaginibacter gracilis]
MKTFYNKLLILLALLTVVQTASTLAQPAVKPTAKITGTVLDNKGAAMPFATVGLLKTKDSSLVKGGITNENGKYFLDRVSKGTYIIRVTVMGYATTNSKIINVADNATDINVPAITLGNSSKTLKEVNITAAKPLIERKLDRTVMNIENSVLAAGNSAMEILERAPGVSIDKDDNISLKGKQGVTIMLDGKLTYLSSAQLATLLRSTDGNTIQSIEIITNPSAKYDAAGNSGIINIKLKKNKQSGTNGSATVTGGYGAYPKNNASVNLNHKDGPVNVFGSFSHGDRQRANDIYLNRIVDGGTAGLTYFNQHTFMPQKSYNNTYRLGADFDTSPKNTLGFLVSGYFNGEHDVNNNRTVIGSTATKIDSVQNTNSGMEQTYNDFAVNLNDKFTIDTAGQELSVAVDYSKFNNTNDAHYDNYFFLADGSTKKPTVFLQNQSPSSIRIITSNVDYTYPISKKIKLETGIKISDVKTDNNLQAQIKKNDTFINDTSRTNHFIYDEQLAAGYVNLSKTYKNTSVQIGVRAENTHSNGNSITQNKVVDRNYIDFFPSLFVNHTLSEKNEVGFSYSRRIDRPSYDDLNPFLYYLDQYTYQQGNPYLNPQYTHSLEFNYTYNKTLNVSLNYSHTSDVITEVVLTNATTKTTYQTNMNLQSQNAYSININTPYNFTKWWSGNVNVNTFYLAFKSNNLDGSNLNDGQLATKIKTTETFQLSKTFRFEFSSNYESPLTYGLFKIGSRYSFDGGMSKSFAQKKFNVKLSLSDIFNTSDNDVSSNYGNNNFSIHQKNESRVARLTLTYNFGNSKIKTRQHSTDSDEKNRVKSGN